MIERLTFRAMDGDCALYGIDVSAAALADGHDWVLRMNRRFSRFSPWSEIPHFNDSAATTAAHHARARCKGDAASRHHVHARLLTPGVTYTHLS